MEERSMSLYFVGDLNILADKRLSMADKIVYFCLVSFMNVKDGKCYPRFATIKTRTGLSIATIQRSVSHLAKLQLISKKRLPSTNLYLLTRQKILQETIKKRVITLSEGRDISQRGLLKEPTYLTRNTRNKYNVNKFYNRKFSNRGVANHTLKTFVYKGETYKNIGEEGHFMEFSGKDGKRIKKHKFKDIVIEENPSRKKFEAAAEKVVACG